MKSAILSEQIRRGRNRLAAIVVSGHAFKHVYNSGWQNLLLPEIKIDMELTGTKFGVLAGGARVTAWGTTMVAGYLGDRFAHKAPLMLGLSMALLGVSFFLAGLAPSYGILLGAALLIGVGPSLYHPPAISSLSRRFPDKPGFAISLHGSGGSAGEVLGPWVAAGLLALMSWRGVLQVSIFPALAAAVVIWLVMRNLTGPSGATSSFQSYLDSLKSLLSLRPMQMLVGTTALRSMGQSAIMAFLPVYLREDLAYSPTLVALYLSMAQIVGIVAQPVMGHLSDRFGTKAVLVPAMTALGLLYAALRWADPGVQLTLTILAMGAFHYSVHVIFIAAAMDIAEGKVQSTVVSLIYGAGFLGTLSPVFAGAIADAYGIPNIFLYAGAVVLLSGGLMAMVRMSHVSGAASET